MALEFDLKTQDVYEHLPFGRETNVHQSSESRCSTLIELLFGMMGLEDEQQSELIN